MPERRLTSGPLLGARLITRVMKRRHYSGICKLSTSEWGRGYTSLEQPQMDRRCFAALVNCLSTSTITITCSFPMAEVLCRHLLWPKVRRPSWAWGKSLITHNTWVVFFHHFFKWKKILSKLHILMKSLHILIGLDSLPLLCVSTLHNVFVV